MDQRFLNGALGGVAIQLDQGTGTLTLDGKEIILMRVKLVDRLFSSIMETPFFSTILLKAGAMTGEEFAIDWLLMRTPSASGTLQGGLPPELRIKGQEYERLEDTLERGNADETILARQLQYANEIRQLLQAWLRTQPQEAIRDMWQRMHELDVYGGWGRAALLQLDVQQGSARIAVSASFIARPRTLWEQFGFRGHKVCSFLEGYFLGEARVLLAREDLTCTEEHCRLEGADRCDFVVQPDTSLSR